MFIVVLCEGSGVVFWSLVRLYPSSQYLSSQQFTRCWSACCVKLHILSMFWPLVRLYLSSLYLSSKQFIVFLSVCCVKLFDPMHLVVCMLKVNQFLTFFSEPLNLKRWFWWQNGLGLVLISKPGYMVALVRRGTLPDHNFFDFGHRSCGCDSCQHMLILWTLQIMQPFFHNYFWLSVFTDVHLIVQTSIIQFQVDVKSSKIWVCCFVPPS